MCVNNGVDMKSHCLAKLMEPAMNNEPYNPERPRKKNDKWVIDDR